MVNFREIEEGEPLIFTNSKGYEYQIRLVGVDEVDEITYENVRIDHPDRPNMTRAGSGGATRPARGS